MKMPRAIASGSGTGTERRMPAVVVIRRLLFFSLAVPYVRIRRGQPAITLDMRRPYRDGPGHTPARQTRKQLLHGCCRVTHMPDPVCTPANGHAGTPGRREEMRGGGRRRP